MVDVTIKEADDTANLPDSTSNTTHGLQIQKALAKEVLAILKTEQHSFMRCVNCPILLQCSYPKKRLEKLKLDAKIRADEVYAEELALDNSIENVILAEKKRDDTFKNYVQDNSEKYLGNDRCVYERGEIINVLSKFHDAGYDLENPRIYLLVKELMSNILITGRANKSFTSLGMLIRKDTPNGSYYYKNPMIQAKLDFSRLVMETIDVLDKMVKSDEDIGRDNDFTKHLLEKLRLKKKERAKEIAATFVVVDENGEVEQNGKKK